jgi:hypothetical protein
MALSCSSRLPVRASIPPGPPEAELRDDVLLKVAIVRAGPHEGRAAMLTGIDTSGDRHALGGLVDLPSMIETWLRVSAHRGII